ncbi:MAG TPA: helix-turn-helix domain-containing protein [Magnetospirillaceae bacterium]|nr:helix-turn-helix domain-containing protein [Magnetospirillaceae bacterium]
MAFEFRHRSSDSAFIETVWYSQDTADGYYLAASDGRLHVHCVTTPQGTSRVYVRRPSPFATPVAYQTGNTNVGIICKEGVFADPKIESMLATLQAPTFDTAEQFVANLIAQNLLASDSVVKRFVAGSYLHVTPRTVQRHFMTAIGLTPTYMQNVQRANTAVRLLQNNNSILQVVDSLGYADQAHLTRCVKQVSGCTPGQIIKKTERARRLQAVQAYGICAVMRIQNFRGAVFERTHQV